MNPTDANRLAELTCQFFRYLDTVEESDEGNEFHPLSFSCCRSMWVADLNAILAEMKALATKYKE